MAEEKKEPWLNYLALTTVIFAVCATLSTFKGGGFSTRSVLNQSHPMQQISGLIIRLKALRGIFTSYRERNWNWNLRRWGQRFQSRWLRDMRKKLNFIKICHSSPQLCWGDEWPTLSPGGRGLG